jgi:flagellar hook assembly protein FlgD
MQEPLSVKPSVLPAHFKVHSAFPNPFNPTTVIGYTLPAAGNVSIRIIDSRGRLIQNNHLGPISKGYHTIRIDGRTWTSGTYFAQVETGGTALTQKITLVK